MDTSTLIDIVAGLCSCSALALFVVVMGVAIAVRGWRQRKAETYVRPSEVHTVPTFDVPKPDTPTVVARRPTQDPAPESPRVTKGSSGPTLAPFPFHGDQDTPDTEQDDN